MTTRSTRRRQIVVGGAVYTLNTNFVLCFVLKLATTYYKMQFDYPNVIAAVNISDQGLLVVHFPNFLKRE